MPWPLFLHRLTESSMNRRNPLFALAMLPVLSSTAHAADSPPVDSTAPAAAGGFAALGRNGDRGVERGGAAASPHLAERFGRLGRNHDGKLTADAFPHRHRHGERGMRGGAALAKLDSDHDGRIRYAQSQTDPTLAVRFAAMDVDKDDFVDRRSQIARQAAS
ncbi:EF-hand domain-containing protein [Xanthomonas theicola]|uniref:EF-hand domain-containing protein n=1 Tax=Xanthomonas theicola TaxID=56464 RepID=UPI00163A7DBF|nr:EF-hand domain-containing protein [Xanthomonas theicola]QNH23630.1 hypothetical protein G4Q83_01030 [Xanthomonas theicola]